MASEWEHNHLRQTDEHIRAAKSSKPNTARKYCSVNQAHAPMQMQNRRELVLHRCAVLGRDSAYLGGRSRAYEGMAFLDGIARTTTNETTPALVARGVFAMNLIAGGIHIGGNPCPM